MTFIADLMRFALYTWGIYEVGTLTSLYWLATKGAGKKDKYTMNTLIFCASVLLMVIVLLSMNILSVIFPDISLILRNGVMIPTICIAISAKLLKRRYLE